MKTVIERFLEYVTHNTKSDEDSSTFPSTKEQLVFANFLAEECKKIGLTNVSVDKNGYVMALLPKNKEGFPKIGFLAHMDTSPDASGKNVKPVITKNYDGKPIKLNGITIKSEDFPELLEYIGEDIITADGTTLLGADDKAGISEILTAMEHLICTPNIPHGDIAIAFTPDEEIGRGVDFFDVKGFNCDFAYTLDGGKIGELEYENFNAARAKITIQGINVHPGTAKNLMKNAVLIGCELSAMFPQGEIPANTDGYDGFYHLVSFNGTVSLCNMAYIIRDFDKTNFENRKKNMETVVALLNKKYNNIIQLELYDEYYNMLEKISPRLEIVTLAKTAMLACGVTPLIRPIRGGTDGARLSYHGLPCPNIFAGGHNFHGIYEYIPVKSMEKAVEVIIKIAELAGK